MAQSAEPNGKLKGKYSLYVNSEKIDLMMTCI